MPASFVSQLFPDGNVPVLEAALRLAHHRQMAIANNLANLETPRYLRQDVPERPFGRMLRQALESRGGARPARWLLPPGLDYRVGQGRFPEPRRPAGRGFPEPAGDGPTRHDANNVAPEAELAALQRNTLALRAMQQLFGRAARETQEAAQFRKR